MRVLYLKQKVSIKQNNKFNKKNLKTTLNNGIFAIIFILETK